MDLKSKLVKLLNGILDNTYSVIFTDLRADKFPIFNKRSIIWLSALSSNFWKSGLLNIDRTLNIQDTNKSIESLSDWIVLHLINVVQNKNT